MRRVLLSLSMVLALSAAEARAQGPPQPAPAQPTPTPGQPTTPQRTPPRAGRPGEDQQKGTAVLRGTVVAADTGDSLSRDMVRAMSPDGRVNSTVTTDAEGRFEINEVVGGRYSISASTSGFVTMSYGQR